MKSCLKLNGKKNPGTVTHDFNLSIFETEAGGFL